MKVKLSNCGNPDHGQDPDRPLWGCPKAGWVGVTTLKEASEVCRRYIDRWELGGGNWSGGDILEDGKLIARISYNGRVWKYDKKALCSQGDEIVGNKLFHPVIPFN